MIEDLRKHLDIVMVVIVAVLIYHFFLKARGVKGGISAPKRL